MQEASFIQHYTITQENYTDFVSSLHRYIQKYQSISLALPKDMSEMPYESGQQFAHYSTIAQEERKSRTRQQKIASLQHDASFYNALVGL